MLHRCGWLWSPALRALLGKVHSASIPGVGQGGGPLSGPVHNASALTRFDDCPQPGRTVSGPRPPETLIRFGAGVRCRPRACSLK
jgi:hypothetical protein